MRKVVVLLLVLLVLLGMASGCASKERVHIDIYGGVQKYVDNEGNVHLKGQVKCVGNKSITYATLQITLYETETKKIIQESVTHILNNGQRINPGDVVDWDIVLTTLQPDNTINLFEQVDIIIDY